MTLGLNSSWDCKEMGPWGDSHVSVWELHMHLRTVYIKICRTMENGPTDRKALHEKGHTGN